MKIESIVKHIEGKEKEIAKLTKKMERILKAKATGWEVNPYLYSESDEKWTAKDLEAAKKALAEYQEDLKRETEKANSRNIAVIIEFLEGWKKKMYEHFERTASEYNEAYRQYREELKKFDLTYAAEEKMRRENYEEYKKYVNEKKAIKDSFKERFGFIECYLDRKQNPVTLLYETVFDGEKLKKDLDEEAKRKYDFIIERTNAIVGEITDAANLTIGAKGDLNGFIVGKNGKATVQTIGAGGYNIQCFHFRTLIKSR